MVQHTPERARLLRRRHLHERQAVVFGSLVAGLAVVGVFSAAVFTGTLDAPFLSRDFTTAAPEDDGYDFPDAPCPAADALPVAYAGVTVNVLNASGRQGLAGQTATDLTTRGFVVLSTGNYPTNLELGTVVQFGEAGIAAAYTLAAHLSEAVLVLDTRTDASIDLALGTGFAALLDPTTVVLDPTVPLVGVTGCVAIEEARANAVPAPTPTPSESTEEVLPDGGEGVDQGGEIVEG